MSFAITIGRWGGFYIAKNPFVNRVCLGWIALDHYKMELDNLLQLAKDTGTWTERKNKG
jgi:hypothetical protein